MNLLQITMNVISSRGQFQFFAYMFLFVFIYGVLVNHTDWKDLRKNAIRMLVILAILNVSFYYRILVILPNVTGTGPSQAAIGSLFGMSVWSYVFILLGLFAAKFVNDSAKKQRGWLYKLLTTYTERFADFVEANLNPATLLRNVAKVFRKQAESVDPIQPLQEALLNHEIGN